ncbi:MULTISPECIES: hypothetical protein [unclassified Mesorhizobium]|uniref:hypothetical protein n=1 Tax=unclassified Mesorhizobium TaxID=325217 RepID=UPI000FD33D0F|nr:MULTISPECIES: hypothetical protein [unclassified Mesorhizobium]RUV98040.1 hypothetical protein EOA88_00645 [Mesorhizobium sp. M5C.F.Ca.IN.020.14.1.1]RUV32104.1 hypothetical protein EOA86_03715 [Mesorhizobium sp. M5C.F.Ca.IN.020.32.2.1]RWG51774.1 MAG: hypothetical protein EOQ62_00470 [Mesorhizobium sp.]RWH51143.1 MAG: hypothetical protein EOQ80_02040 [Mesorhizobium sp.]RWH59149.1 MAG: hypothetical protein EOQ82_04725 [Mesorhizobium sp.]
MRLILQYWYPKREQHRTTTPIYRFDGMFSGVALKSCECHHEVAEAQMDLRLERVFKRMASIARRRLPFLSLALEMVRATGMHRMLVIALSRLK